LFPSSGYHLEYLASDTAIVYPYRDIVSLTVMVGWYLPVPICEPQNCGVKVYVQFDSSI
jgi:hypothetical protein